MVGHSSCVYNYPAYQASEIRTEICLPPSGLAKVAYPDVFPTPPGASPQPGEESSTGRADCISESSGILLDPELENSWSYYLSDIAVRRIGNRLMNSFYKEDESTWLSIPVDRLMRVAEELEAQLTQWSVVYIQQIVVYQIRTY
jgi:hypothetical protein